MIDCCARSTARLISFGFCVSINPKIRSGEHPSVPPGDAPRGRREVRILVPTALQQGWLAFQSGVDRRRLAPIPVNWIDLGEEELINLLGRADRLTETDAK